MKDYRKCVTMNIWGHSPECLATFPRMFEDIPQNIWRHSSECNIPLIPHVPRIPLPVPVFLVLYIADLVSIVVSNRAYENYSSNMLWNRVSSYVYIIFYVYRNNWEPVIGEVLKRVWSRRTKSISMQWLLLIMRTMLLVIYQIGRVENMQKQYFTFWKQIPRTFVMLKLQERL